MTSTLCLLQETGPSRYRLHGYPCCWLTGCCAEIALICGVDSNTTFPFHLYETIQLFYATLYSTFYRAAEYRISTKSALVEAILLSRWYLIVCYPNHAVPNLRRIIFTYKPTSSRIVAQCLISSLFSVLQSKQ